jgi:LPS-assembly protein
MRRALVLLCALLLWPALAPAQTASLLADRLRIEADRRLVAEGEVEILYEGTRLRAPRLIFDQAANTLLIEGPITLTEGDRVVILADQAALDADLENGILISARLVLDRQLQLAANRIDRVGGRYTQLTRAVTSSCQVCPGGVPTWEIRARRVIHDQQERQIYFDQAVFRFVGLPIFYIPRLRLPDPTLDRAAGFLIPEIRTTSRLGVGLKLPYFIPFGAHADLRLTPYVSPQTRTLELEYRHEFRAGRLQFSGAVSDDDVTGGSRYYAFVEGAFRLPARFRLDFDGELVSDPEYLRQYGYTDKDRLDSEIRVSRVARDELIRASLYSFETLRTAELPIADQLPSQYALVLAERRMRLAGGELSFGLDAAALVRDSTAPVVGRDMQRLGLRAGWRGTAVTAAGIVATAEAHLAGHGYAVQQDPNFPAQAGRVTTGAALTLRWPFQKTGAGMLIEPVAQLAYVNTTGAEVPNEDSPLVEFDEGNLFALNRFPGSDAVEQGLRANLGIGFTRYDPAGWSTSLTLGRVVRLEDRGQFNPGTGLDGRTSDWLAALQLRLTNRLELTHRMLFDDAFAVTKAESRLAVQSSRAALAGTYVYLAAEPAANRPTATNEVTLDAAYRLTRNWTGKLDGRFDLEADRTAQAGVGVEYRSECLRVDLSLSRRFSSSTSVSPSTNVGFQVSLTGLGGNESTAAYRRACNG